MSTIELIPGKLYYLDGGVHIISPHGKYMATSQHNEVCMFVTTISNNDKFTTEDQLVQVLVKKDLWQVWSSHIKSAI